MAIFLIELAPDLVAVDETRFPDKDRHYVYEHLLYYCSLFDPLPAIAVKVEADGPVVISRHKYLAIARQLGRLRIRAVIDRSCDPGRIEALLRRPDVQQLDWNAIDALERATPVRNLWHVFFFERPLRFEEKQLFNERVAGFFTSLARERFPGEVHGPGVSDVLHDDRRCLAQFQAETPVGDESWFPLYLSEVRRFHQNCAHVVSYQGGRFDG